MKPTYVTSQNVASQTILYNFRTTSKNSDDLKQMRADNRRRIQWYNTTFHIRNDLIRTSLRLATHVDNNSFAVSEFADVIKSIAQ